MAVDLAGLTQEAPEPFRCGRVHGLELSQQLNGRRRRRHAKGAGEILAEATEQDPERFGAQPCVAVDPGHRTDVLRQLPSLG